MSFVSGGNMNKKEKALWIGASFFMPILLSVIFAVTANLLHFKQLISFFSWPFAVFFLLFPLFFFLLFQWRYKRWKRDVLTLKDSGKVHASLRRILNEYILYSLVSFLSLAFFFSSRALGEKDDHLLIFLICMGVMMTVYAPFYFGMLVRMYRYLYRIGFPVAFEKNRLESERSDSGCACSRRSLYYDDIFCLCYFPDDWQRHYAI